ncbi:MAG: hypothetical protein ACJ79S_10700 [Gemmatimonadaceae bacterium]
MSEHGESPISDYPHGRGYGHDYMRGGEVFGGYGYAERAEYELPRGDLAGANGPTGGMPDGGARSADASGGSGLRTGDSDGVS